MKTNGAQRFGLHQVPSRLRGQQEHRQQGVLRGAARDRKEDRKRKVTDRRRKGAGREAELVAEADQEADKEKEEEEEEEASEDRAAGQPHAKLDAASWTQTGQGLGRRKQV